MTCPDIERILELALDESADPEARAHVQECEDCRARLRLVTAARGAYTPELHVPEHLVLRARDAVVAEARRSGDAVGADASLTPWSVVASFLLGSSTVLLAAFGTGSGLGGSSLPLMLMATLAGVVAVVYELFEERLASPL